ncbi:MAG TPA: hypothetical protein VMX97_04505 [Hyphomicrobiaceae bacterium]|nr:hypothetical protein [Hyphomicrobiaceae bacterium]
MGYIRCANGLGASPLATGLAHAEPATTVSAQRALIPSRVLT